MHIVVALVLTIVGLIWATPGALPPAADPWVRWGRILAGAGMVLQGLGWLIEDKTVIGAGALLIGIGLGATAWAIHMQPCRKP
jgi:hypothetical protein